MKMTRNEMKILFTFGCADREATVTRLFYVGSVTVDPSARKQILELAKKLGKGKTVVTILPDTGERYLSAEIYR